MDGSEAAILTTERVMHHIDGDTVSIDLKDIDDLSIDYWREGPFEAYIIEVRSKSGMELSLPIAPNDNGVLFYNALMDAWNLQKTR